MNGIASLIFIGCCLFIPMILAHLDRPRKAVEVVRYQTVYIQSPKENVVYKPPKMEEKFTPSVKPAKEAVPPIFNECVEVLTALGMKKTLAKEKTSQTLGKYNCSSVEEFLMEIYKK